MVTVSLGDCHVVPLLARAHLRADLPSAICCLKLLPNEWVSEGAVLGEGAAATMVIIMLLVLHIIEDISSEKNGLINVKSIEIFNLIKKEII